MKLNRLNLIVTNVKATHDFLQTYSGLESLGKPNKNMGFLTDDKGIILSMFRGNEVSYPDTFHIGFIQESNEKVDEINARLKADGYDVPPPSQQHGSWTFYFTALGGFEVLS